MRNFIIAMIIFIVIFFAYATWHKQISDARGTGETLIQKSQGPIYHPRKGVAANNTLLSEDAGSDITIMADAQKCDAGQCRIGKRRK